MAVNDIYRVAVEQTLGSDQIVNVVHYRTTLSVGTLASEVAALAEALEEDYAPAWVTFHAAAVRLDRFIVRSVTNPTMGSEIAIGDQGAVTGTVLNAQFAPMSLLRTGLIGRSYQGRIFHAPPVEADWEGAALSTAWLTRLAAFHNAIVQIGITTGGGTFAWQLGVYSKKLNQINDVTGIEGFLYPRSQRKRRPGVGQ